MPSLTPDQLRVMERNALLNAVGHAGKAEVGAVVSRSLGESPELRAMAKDVAKAAADQIIDQGTSLILQSRRFSGLMIKFLCDLTGHETARRWAATVLHEAGPSEAAKQNALAVDGQLKVGVRKRLAGVDLRGQNLAGEDLSDADLRGARLTAAKLDGSDIWRANLMGCIISPKVLHAALNCRSK